VVNLSKLEHYMEIIQILYAQNLTKMAVLAEKTGVAFSLLEKRLQFLIDQGLVEQKRSENHELLILTEEGKKVFNYFMKSQSRVASMAPIDILFALAEKSSSKLLWLMYKTSLGSSVLKSFLGVLIKQGLVEEKQVQKHITCYAITCYGLSVIRSFQKP